MSETRRLGECRELEYILFGDLRDLLEEDPNYESVRWIKAVLDTLLETIPEEFALKSESGYLSGVLEEYPNWEGQVSRLEDEYYQLYRQLRNLRLRLEQDEDYRELGKPLSNDLAGWMDAFRRHIQSEQQIVMLAANLETGGGD